MAMTIKTNTTLTQNIKNTVAGVRIVETLIIALILTPEVCSRVRPQRSEQVTG